MPTILNNLDLVKNQLLNAAIQNLASHPPNPVLGQIYFNTVDKAIYVCTDAGAPTWSDVGSSLSGEQLVALINGSVSVIDLDNLPAGVATAITQSHVHSNKATLDTYDQTNANLTDAVAKKHSHANMADLANVSGTNTGDENNATIKVKLGAASGSNDGYLAASDFATFAAKGVTNGDAHDHNGGDGAQIAYSSLSGRPTLGTAASKDTGTASGNIPILDANGKLAEAVIPALALNEAFPVASQSAMLALDAQKGDIAIRSDLNKAFILGGNGDPSVLGNWLELLTPTDTVLSVNGKTGAVTLAKGDVGLGNVTNESKATMFASPTFTGTVTVPTPTAGDSTTKAASTAFVQNAMSGKASKYAASIGGATSATLNHNLGTQDVTVTLREAASPYSVVEADVEVTNANSVTIRFGTAPMANSIRAVVVG